jgi:hypothetical protein
MGRGDVTDGLPRVLALVAEADGPSAWRIFQPFAALTSRGYPAADWDWKDNPLLGELVATGRYDAVILPRLSWNDADEAAAERWMAALHRAGLATIYEVDDDFFSPQFLRQQRQAGLEAARCKSDAELDAQRLARIRALQRCDGVTVSSHRLATVVRQYVAADVPVCVVPNAIDWRWYCAVLTAWRTAARMAARVKPALVPPSNTVTIGWAGGARPDADVAVMAQAWAAVGKMRPQTRFVVQGYHPTVIDEALTDAALAAERVEWRPWLPLEQYPAGLAGVQIACAPLADAPFNRCKCVTGETLVNTAWGLEPLASLGQSCAVGGTMPVTVIVWTTTGWQVATEFYSGGEQEVLTVTTEDGFQITGTEEHPVRRADGSWVLLRDLRVGDDLRLEPVQLFDKERAVAFNPWAIRNRRAADQSGESLPRVCIDRHWGALLGYLIGDGNIGKNAVRITCDKQDEDVVADIVAHFRAIGIEPTFKTVRHNQPQYGGVDVCASSARFNDFLWSLGVERDGRKFLGVPTIILKSPAHVVHAFLAALFESDGTVDQANSRASFTTMSARLAREVQLLLTAFGVRARTEAVFNRRYQRSYFRVVLNRAALDEFASGVGFVGARKREKVAAAVAKPHSNRFRPQRWADKVATIERGRAPVYDLTVPNGHEFAANGLMVHNTPIKAMEAAALGAAVVASPTVYGSVIVDGESGALCRTVEEWTAALLRLVDDARLRRQWARALRHRVEKHHTLEGNLWRWPAAWQTILEAFRKTHTRRLLAC